MSLFANFKYYGEKQKFKDNYGQYVTAEFIINSKNESIDNLSNAEILEETESSLKVKFMHDETTIVKLMNEISNYCKIDDIHIKEAELEDILKEIYKGAHTC